MPVQPKNLCSGFSQRPGVKGTRQRVIGTFNALLCPHWNAHCTHRCLYTIHITSPRKKKEKKGRRKGEREGGEKLQDYYNMHGPGKAPIDTFSLRTLIRARREKWISEKEGKTKMFPGGEGQSPVDSITGLPPCTCCWTPRGVESAWSRTPHPEWSWWQQRQQSGAMQRTALLTPKLWHR